MPTLPLKLPPWKLIMFAMGQMGWSLASYGAYNLIVYFYMPPETGHAGIFPPFIYQGTFFAVFTVVGLINSGSRFFGALINPIVASWSDRSRSRIGRRRIFMVIAAIPCAFFAVLIFFPLQTFSQEPSLAGSLPNIVWLGGLTLIFFFFFVMYMTPYTALISELGHSPRERLFIGTALSVTWAIGFALGNMTYLLQGFVQHFFAMTSIQAFQAVQISFGILSLVLMLLPVVFVDEGRYAARHVATEPAFRAMAATLKNRFFLRYLGVEFVFVACQTLIQTGIVYYLTTLLRLSTGMTSTLMIFMFALSFAFYPLVNLLVVRFEKKRVLLAGAATLAVVFVLFALMGILPIQPDVYAFGTAAIAAFPVAIFGILPTVVVADIAESHGRTTGTHQAGMFFGLRALEMNLGQAVANGVFPTFLTLGMSVENPLGVRVSAAVACALCLLGIALFARFDEKALLKSLQGRESAESRAEFPEPVLPDDAEVAKDAKGG